LTTVTTQKPSRKENQRARQQKYYKANKQKVLARNRAWRKNNPDKHRSTHLKSRYGITVEQSAALFVGQGSVCAICKTETPPNNGWHVDHDHLTNKVRGVLCRHCNLGIGYFKDDTGFLANAISYLQNPPADTTIH
jgi:hypothetical protein